jgi:hypothetical protein
VPQSSEIIAGFSRCGMPSILAQQEAEDWLKAEPQRLKPRSFFAAFYGTTERRALPDP